MKIKKIQSVIVATAVLHNICCMDNDIDAPPNNSVMEIEISNVLSTPNNRLSTRESNNITRRLLVDNYFANL